MDIKGVRSARYGPTQPKGASSGADFGTSPREREHAVWAGFEIAGLMGAKSTQRMILVVGIHSPASPAIGQICSFYAGRSMSRALEQEAYARERGWSY